MLKMNKHSYLRQNCYPYIWDIFNSFGAIIYNLVQTVNPNLKGLRLSLIFENIYYLASALCSIALPTRSIIIVRNSGEKKTLPDDQDTKGWKGGYRDAWKFIASRRNTATWVSWMKSLLVMQYTKALKTWNEPPHYNVVGKPPTPCAEIRCKT